MIIMSFLAECREFPVADNVATMKKCWKTHEDAIVDVDQSHLNKSSEMCKQVDNLY